MGQVTPRLRTLIHTVYVFSPAVVVGIATVWAALADGNPVHVGILAFFTVFFTISGSIFFAQRRNREDSRD